MLETQTFLKEKIDITEVPFSFPGSRILIYQKNRESLIIKLAERLINEFPGIESYLTRRAFIDDIVFIDENENQLEICVQTIPQQINIDTKVGLYQIAFTNETTIRITLPSNNSCGINFCIHAVDFRKFSRGGVYSSYRTLVYRSNTALIKHTNTKVNPMCSTVSILAESKSNSCITLEIGEALVYKDVLPNDQDGIEKCEAVWLKWFSEVPEVDPPYQDKYNFAWWVLANNIIRPKGNIHFYTAVPSKKSYIGAWLWDNAMHAIALRHYDPELARDQIRAMLAFQLENGMLPDAIFDDGIVSEIDHPVVGFVTKPPILAWSAIKINEVDPNKQFFEEIYEPLVRWNQWWFDQNDDDGDGIVQYNHPYSSGLDDHPAWDFGVPVDSPDLNTYLFIQMQSLAKIAVELGRLEEGQEWEKKANNLLERMLTHLWNEEKGYFEVLKNGKPLPVFTIVNLLPLWTARLPDDVNQKIINFLFSPQYFGGQYSLATVSRSDTKYEPERMWRGPAWANINYFFIDALNKLNMGDLAADLRKKTLKLILENKGIYEYYNSATGKPGLNAAPNFGWSAAVFIDLAIQESALHKEKEKN